MSDTPETDKLIGRLDEKFSGWGDEFVALTKHAKKLEQERNNWREVAQIAVAARDRNKAEWERCAAELAAVLNGFDDMDAADAETEALQ